MSGVLDLPDGEQTTTSSSASPPPDDPLQSMKQMDEQVQKSEPDTPVGQPSTPCHDKIELTLYSEDGEPLANAEYSVTLADGTVKSGNLDEKGHVVIEHATLEKKDAKILISSVTGDDGTETLKIEIGAAVEPNADDGEASVPAGVVQAGDIDAPWEPY